MSYSDTHLKTILSRSKVIACVGFSANPARPSHGVAKYLSQNGYRVVPVNPGLVGQSFFGEAAVADLGSIGKDIVVDMVDVFRRSDAVPEIVTEALSVLPGLATVWMQIGVEHAGAAELAQARGVAVIQNLCPKIEYQRLFG